ncbi:MULTISPECIES: hypothetical protein [unclassified Clostridium]|uniref:IS1/IS1595 family N-terminal zinc-binding domain-containing protein n=1 Tax=unclassified Clostridium TaxID=2614128 RepID=UPI00029827A4|nr:MULTISPECIES: hypothetical protein [unclassified Clostridium]EKQ57421.1 MAG: hypothetical protein A370_00955 [Clostridium sp. Maddingley MBC34-26]
MIQEDIKLKKLKTHVNYILRKDFYDNRVVKCCPICGGSHYIKNGLYKGIQRYKCRECNKTFSKATDSLWSYSKKNPEIWLEFIELMLEKKSLRFCAKKLKISLVTAFFWRHKVLYALSLDGTQNSLEGIVYITKTILKENFKGCRNIEFDFTTQRRRNIWIVGAKGDEDSMFVKPVFREAWDWKTYYEKVYSKVEKKAYMVPYGDRYLEIAAKEHNKKQFLEVKDDDRVKYFTLNLENWLKVFRGVATKYLQRYLSFFVLYNLDKELDYVQIMLSNLLNGDRFIKTNKVRRIENYMY